MLADSGLSAERIDEVVDLAVPAHLLVPADAAPTPGPGEADNVALELRLLRSPATGDIPGGRTHIGGLPLLPPDYPWPEIDGQPLILHLQLDLDALDGAAGPLFPDHGILQFYSDEGNWNDHGIVLWFESTDGLEVRNDVHTPFADERIPLYRNFRPILSIPQNGDRVFAHWSGAEWEAYWRATGDPTYVDQIGGWAYEFQNDPVYSIATKESGLEFGDVFGDVEGLPDNPTDAERDAFRQRRVESFAAKTDDEQWRLLLQLTTAPGDSMFGDAGFFWMMGQHDRLIEGDFSNIRQDWASH